MCEIDCRDSSDYYIDIINEKEKVIQEFVSSCEKLINGHEIRNRIQEANGWTEIRQLIKKYKE